jgi:D-alanyl-D-alanine carboxypeptidase/D-alanyl-D-alanine-endopeptidase (penicillin-binding protein 4)
MRSARRLAASLLAVTLGLGSALAADGAPAVAAACSIDRLADDPRLASFSGYVSDAKTGEKLFSESGSTPKSTGSVLKLLTAAAAVEVLGNEHRMTTTVVAGTKPGTVVLVGGGDPTLSRVSNGFYPGAPRLATLARQVKKALHGQRVKKVVVDSSYWDDSDAWDPTWKRSEQRIGYHSEVSALQVDGDRNNPRASTSPRSTHPATRAGRWFAEALGVPNVRVVSGTAPEGAKRLGAVRSQPLSSLIRTMLLTSDNSLAETIARVTSIEAGASGSRRSLDSVVGAALARYGLNTSRIRVYDGSGLSTRNRVPAKFVTQLVRALRSGPSELRTVYRSMPVAGRTGSLAYRFTGSNAVARGHVRAKTGWLDTEYSLAGIVHARDGSQLSFAFYAIGRHVQPSAKVALDGLATQLYRCGSQLG